MPLGIPQWIWWGGVGLFAGLIAVNIIPWLVAPIGGLKWRQRIGSWYTSMACRAGKRVTIIERKTGGLDLRPTRPDGETPAEGVKLDGDQNHVRNDLGCIGWLHNRQFGFSLEKPNLYVDALWAETGEKMYRARSEDTIRTDVEVATDGGHATAREAGDRPMSTDSPPVIQDNPGPVKPFEALVEVINRPRYSELDPTVFLFLTFPLFFGLMIGDLGYGILYVALGYYLYTGFDSEVIRSLGGVGILSGIFTIIFGVLYGEVFGLHILGEVVWEQGLGMKGSPLHKGLQPGYIDYAFFWLVMSVLFGLAHLTIGYVLDFYEKLDHGLGHAVGESGSWLMMMGGVWVWVFSDAAAGSKPEFLVGQASVFNGNPIALGFTGFPAIVGWVGVAVFFVGLVLLAYTEVIEAVEALNVLVNVLSYTRLTAVLLAKAGMAFVVNLLVLGAYQSEDGEYHFIFMEGGEVHGEVLFPGMVNGSGVELVVGALAGIVILVLGHGLVLVLGITSAGLQAVRLEYVEFFSKFYEGGGDEYEPFGYERRFTTDD